jgi:hypothetical protein
VAGVLGCAGFAGYLDVVLLGFAAPRGDLGVGRLSLKLV